MKRIAWIAGVATCLALLSGCHNSGHAQNSTDMRALNAVADAEALDVLVDNDVKAAAIAPGATSSYSEFDSGTRDVQVRSSVNAAVLSDKSISFSSGSSATLLVYGKRSAINTLLLADDTTSPDSGDFRFRAVGLASDSGAVDVYITTADIASTPATVAAVTYASVSAVAQGTAGSYRVIVTAAGTKDVLLQSPTVSFSAGTSYTLAVVPALGGKLVNAVLLTQSAGTFMANPLGRLKAVNAMPDSTNLNFKVDGATLLSSVPFTGSSSYVTTATGAHTLQLELSNAPGSIVAAYAQAIDPAHDYSVAALGSLAQPRLAVFADDNSLPPAGFAKLRFANTIADSSVDVLVNFASQATAIAYGSASSYYPLAAATDYTITFATPGGVSVIVALTPVTLDAGAVYTAYLFGSAAAPTARLVRDR